jgi:hypothetical protein
MGSLVMGSPMRSPRAASVGDDGPPEARAWWFHSSPLALDDPLAPLPKAALEEGAWKPFSGRDCKALEMEWDKLPEEVKRRWQRLPDEDGVVDELATPGGKTQGSVEDEEEVEDVSLDDSKVIVGVERLHHVDLVSQTYVPLFRLCT